MNKYDELWEKLQPSGITQKKNEIIELWQLFERINPKIILEIGISQGGTFAGWCYLADDNALLIGIDRDPNDCRPREGEQVHPDIADPCLKMTEEFGGMWVLKRKGSHQTIIPIKGWSYEPRVMNELLEVLGGDKIDFLFHDASHEESMTRKDFELYWPLIAPNGVMAFHDIGFSNVPEVTKYKWWREVRDDGPQSYAYSYQLPDRLNLSMGIGVLFK
jgi:predicted O-methyltransferase YrrM